MADETPKQATPAQTSDSIQIPTTEPELPLIPLDESALNPEYDPAKDQRAPFLKTPINPTGPTISPAPPRSVGQVIKEAATENIPQFSSRTRANPNYGKQSFLPDSEIMTQQQRREAPALAGALDVASELASPATIGTVAATAGVGEAGVIPKVLSGLFAGQIATSVYDQYPALKDAVNRAQTAKTKEAHDDAFADAQRILTHMGADTVMGLLAAKHGAEGAKEILDTTTGSGVPDQSSTFKNPGVEPAPEPEETHPEMNRDTVKQLRKLGYSNQHITNFNISEIRDILKNQTPAAEYKPAAAPEAPKPAPEPDKFAESGGKLVGLPSAARPIEQATVETTPEGGKITTGSPENTKDIFAAERQLVSSGRLTQADIGRLRNNAMDRWEAAGRPGGVFENFYANALRQATSINVSADPIEDLIMSDKIGGKKVRGAPPPSESKVDAKTTTALNAIKSQIMGDSSDQFEVHPKGSADASYVEDYRSMLLADGSMLSPTNAYEPPSAEHEDMGFVPTTHDDLVQNFGYDILHDANAIRVAGNNMFDLHGRPTESQLSEMARLVKESGEKNVVWDFHTGEGNTDPNYENTLEQLRGKHITSGHGTLGDFRRAMDKVYPETNPEAFAEHGGKFVGKSSEAADKMTTAIANLYMDRDENAHPFAYSYSAPFTNKTAPSLILPDGRITNARLSHSELARAAGFEPKAGELSTTHIDDMLDSTGAARIIYPEGGRGNIGVQIHQPPTQDQLQIVAHNLNKAAQAGVGDGSLVWDLKNSEGRMISGSGSIGDFRRAVDAAYPDQQDLVSKARIEEPPHRSSYAITVTDANGTRNESVDAFSNNDAMKLARKKFPDAEIMRRPEADETHTPSTAYEVPTGKRIKMPPSYNRPEEDTERHEVAHALVALKNGLQTGGVLSTHHPIVSSDSRAVHLLKGAGLRDPATGRIREDKRTAVLASGMAGIASDEIQGVHRAANLNFDIQGGGDGEQAYNILKAAGFSHKDAMEEMHRLIDENIEYLKHPAYASVVNENVGAREKGLSRQFHYSPERLQNMHAEIERRKANAESTATDNRTSDEATAAGRAANVPGGEGEVSRTGEGQPQERQITNAEKETNQPNLRNRATVEQNGETTAARASGESEAAATKPTETEEGIVSEEKIQPKNQEWVDSAKWEENPNTGYRRLVLRDDSGKQAGRIAHDNYRIRLSELDDKYVNQGIGKALYERAFADAKQNGVKELMSDTSLSPDAARVWDSLAKSGKYNITAEPSKEVNRGKVGNAYDNLHTQYTVHFDQSKNIISEEKIKKAPKEMTPELAQQIIDAHDAAGGSTFNLTHGNLAGTDNYAVSTNPERGLTLNHPPTTKDIQDFAAKNQDLLKNPDKSLGTWHNTANDTHVLDVVSTLTNRKKAVALGKKNNQIAIYHLGGEGEIPTGGTGVTPLEPSTGGTPEAPAAPPMPKASESLPLVSTRMPSKTVKGETIEEHTNGALTSDMQAAAAAPGYLQKLADRVADTPGFKDPGGDATTRTNAYIRHIADNVKFVWSKLTPEAIKHDEQWYPVGAHERGIEVAKQHAIDPHQAYAVTAALSPLTDWDQNTSQAERAVNIWKNQQNTKFTPEMKQAGKDIASIPAMKKFASKFKKLEGKTLGELTDVRDQALWLRLYDEGHNSRAYQTWNPDGTPAGIAKNQDGSPKAMGWSFQNLIEHAIDILKDVSQENISKVLGTGHKVRNFYNNQLAPDDPRFLTIDTHAVNVGQLRPMSGKTPAVKDNFGGISNKPYGLKGTYALHDAGYRLAAKELDIPIPSRLQSPTWVKIREVFPNKFKTPENQQAIDAIWKEHTDGKITIDDARNKIWDYAEGWNSRNAGGVGDTSDQGELFNVGVHGESAQGTAGRGTGSDVAPANQEVAPEEDASFNFGANVKPAEARSRTSKIAATQRAKNDAMVKGLAGLIKSGKK